MVEIHKERLELESLVRQQNKSVVSFDKSSRFTDNRI